jgi:hypothetical protein
MKKQKKHLFGYWKNDDFDQMNLKVVKKSKNDGKRRIKKGNKECFSSKEFLKP